MWCVIPKPASVMQRIPRKASLFGTIELADALAGELKVPLAELPGKFSFEVASRTAQENDRLMHGKRAENMFEYVVASLGKAALITREDAGTVAAEDEVVPPDYFIALKDGQRYFVEVKNRRLEDFGTSVTLTREYLAKLSRYAELKGHPLLIAVYWSNLGRHWTINRASDVMDHTGGIQLTFEYAFRNNIGAAFGDRLLMAIPPLRCRFWPDLDKPRSLSDQGEAQFTTKRVTFYSGDVEIVDDAERELALYIMFHSSWSEGPCVAQVDEQDEIVYVQFESAPDEDSVVPGQEMQGLGTLGGMISNYYNWLTLNEDQRIVALTPNTHPGALASGIGDGFRGKVLKLWILSTVPASEARIEPE